MGQEDDMFVQMINNERYQIKLQFKTMLVHFRANPLIHWQTY